VGNASGFTGSESVFQSERYRGQLTIVGRQETVMVEYDPFNRTMVDNAFEIYKQLRNEAPVYHNPEIGFYALSRYDDVVNAHLDVETFSSTHGVTIEGIDEGSPFLIVKDPPDHSWHRKIVSRVFTPRRIAELEPFIRSVTTDLLDKASGQDTFDLVGDFSFRMPLDVISELIGIPREHRETVHELSELVAARDGINAVLTGAAQAPDDGAGQGSSAACDARPTLSPELFDLVTASKYGPMKEATR